MAHSNANRITNDDTNPAKSELTYRKSQHFEKSFFGQEVPRAVPALRNPTQDFCPRNLKLPYTYMYIVQCTYLHIHCIQHNASKQFSKKSPKVYFAVFVRQRIKNSSSSFHNSPIFSPLQTQGFNLNLISPTRPAH